jgi:hypothetical protein
MLSTRAFYHSRHIVFQRHAIELLSRLSKHLERKQLGSFFTPKNERFDAKSCKIIKFLDKVI